MVFLLLSPRPRLDAAPPVIVLPAGITGKHRKDVRQPLPARFAGARGDVFSEFGRVLATVPGDRPLAVNAVVLAREFQNLEEVVSR